MNYNTVINEFKRKKVLVVGDLMLDKYIYGSSSRISPEAPVPVIKPSRTEHRLGGAANVAKNIFDLGAVPLLVGTVGSGADAKSLLNLLKKTGISNGNIFSDRSKPTTLKTRIISDDQQIVRIDEEDSTAVSTRIEKQIIDRVSRIIRTRKPDAIIISDYNKGTITAGLCREIIRIAKKSRIFISVDPKGHDFKKYKGANILTPNKNEAEFVAGYEIRSDSDIKKALRRIKKETGTEGVLITRGKNGVSLIRDSKISYVPALKKQVYDVTGAGDTFISAFTLGAICSNSWDQAAYLANVAASLSISSIGTTSVKKEELVNEIEKLSQSVSKVKTLKQLQHIVSEERKNGMKVVFTNGCFDIIHTGHLKVLKESKQLGDILIVGLNSDKSVRRLKGKDRPVVKESDRATIISSFNFVDYVVIFNEDDPLNTIKALRPDIITKGGDYKPDQVVGKKFVEKYGGKVKIIPLEKNRSTSQLLSRIKENP